MSVSVNRAAFNSIPQKWAFDPEIGPFVRELLSQLRQLRDRTGGDDDSVSRLENETLFDVGIRGGDIAELQSKAEELQILAAATDGLRCQMLEIQKALQDIQTQITDSYLILSELSDLRQRVEAIENGNTP